MYIKYLLILFLFPLAGLSQPVLDVANIKYQYFPNQYFKNDAEKIRGREFNVTALVPILRKDSSAFLFGMNYRSIHSNDKLYPFTLYSAALNFGYNFIWKNKKWSTTGIFIPKISADEFRIDHNNMQYGGVILFKYKHRSRIHYMAGLYYNREVFGNYYVPLAGLNWKASRRITVYGILPATFNVEYKVNSSFYTGISYSTLTSTYRLHGELENYYLKEGEKKVGNTQLRLILNWYARKGLMLFLEPGFTYKRVYSLHDFTYEKITQDVSGSQSSTHDGFFVMGGVAYRIRFDK